MGQSNSKQLRLEASKEMEDIVDLVKDYSIQHFSHEVDGRDFVHVLKRFKTILKNNSRLLNENQQRILGLIEEGNLFHTRNRT